MSLVPPSSPPKKSKSQKSNYHESSQIQQMHLIQKEVLKRLTNPQQSIYCNCNICMANYQLKQRGKAFLRQTSSSMRIQSSKTQQFLSLITAVSSKIYMRLDIPEVCFFFKGQPKRLFKSNNSGVHQIPLTPEVKKHLINVFLDNRRTITNNNLQSTLSFFSSQQRDTHIKNFSAVVPSYKYGEHIQTKKPMSFIFHNNKYSDDPVVGLQKTQAQQICILKTRDKGLQLINQKQLRQTFKSLLYLQNVDFIQTYIKPNDKQDQIYEAVYNKIKGPENSLMFNRSLTQVKTEINLINKFSKDYIPMETLQNYQLILKDIPQQYCLYQTYKMVHYMELTKDVTIQRLGTFWLKNQSQQLCYFGLSDFQWHQNEKFSVDIGQIQQLKQIMSSSLSDFEQELLNAWQHMKSRKLKLNQKVEIDKQKQQQFQQIKRQSLERLSKQKQLSMIMKRSKNKSHMEKNSQGHHHN